MKESTRAYIYRIVLAILAVALIYGLIRREDLPLWIELVAAVLGIGTNALATKNTSTKAL